MQQQQSPPPQSQQQQQQLITSAHVSSPAVTNSRSNRLLYRRGLPDLPELIEAEDEDVINDDFSVNTYSTRHSANTTTSLREFSSIPSSAVGPLKTVVSSDSRPDQPFYQIYTQTPPGSVNQLQTPFDYVPSGTFRYNPLHQEEASPPPSPTFPDETSSNAGMGYGLCVSIETSGNFCADESGMDDEYHESGMVTDTYEEIGCTLANCPECSGVQPFPQNYYQSSSSGEVNSSDVGEYMSPPSSPGTDYADDQERFYGLATQSYRSLERPRSPSLLIDNDTFSSVPHLPSLPPYPSQPEVTSPNRVRSTKGLLGRRGTAVLNKVLPRSLRLKRWSSTPTLPKLQILSPPLLPRMASTANTMPSPTQGPRTPGPVPLNTAFDYDPYSDTLSDDEDEYECRRPTTRGTMMSREQLPTPPFLPIVGSSLPYIPPLDSPVSLSFPQSPSASVHNLGLSGQAPIFPPLQQQSVRNNSITSLSNHSLTSTTPISSPTFASPLHRPLDLRSPVATPPVTALNISSLCSITTPQHSPQMTHRQFFLAMSEDVEDLLQQMELEDTAFAATEQRMATSGWSTETELEELRAKRQVVRREWEERIENAKKKRRGSDGGLSTHGSTYGTINSEHSATPVITLPATSIASNDSNTTLYTTVQL